MEMWDDDDYYDGLYYGDEDDYYAVPYEDTEYLPDSNKNYTLTNLWHDCISPTTSEGFSSVFTNLMCCLLLRFTASLDFVPEFVTHTTSAASGVYCLYNFFESDCKYVVALAVVGYISILSVHNVIKRCRGLICSVLCLIFLVSCELLIVERSAWHKIRGSQMILAMKLISLAFDLDGEDQAMPNPNVFFGYAFSAGTVIFGPWVSFTTYSKLVQQVHTNNFKWALKIVKSSVIGFIFLSLSTCWTSFFLQGTSWRWLGAYRDALSFRSSHYFVSFMSEALAVSSGLSTSTEHWELPVSHPYNIELPRSLVEVVIHWNLPTHFWLKTYVFKTAKPLGNFSAVLLTYAASSLLHGLNFQLAAVLLSLGFYTYIEHVLRKHLSEIFNACILARKCKKECDHEFKHNHIYVRTTNLAFGLLSMFHLAYLGVMFNSISSVQEEGYSMEHTLDSWSKLKFASHWVALATYVFYLLVR